MALIPIGPWKRDSTYRVHPLGLKDSTYRVPLLDSKLVRLHYAWYYRIKSSSGPSSAFAALRTPQPSFGTLKAVEPRLTYPNLYILHADPCNKSYIWTPQPITLPRSCCACGVTIGTSKRSSYIERVYKIPCGM